MSKPIKIGFIAGSHRQNSQSARVAEYLCARAVKLIPQLDTFSFSLAGNPLPLWDEGVWKKGSEPWHSTWLPISQELASCDAVVVVAPEWAGMVPPGLKNFLLLAADGSLAHKAGLIVGVSAGLGGAFVVDELRISGYKNAFLNWLPEHLIARNVGGLFVGDAPASKDDEYIRGRADYALKLLAEYAKALRLVREAGVIDSKTYPYGLS